MGNSVAGGTEQPPYHAYATIVGTFLAGLGAVSGIAAAREPSTQELSAIELALLGLATFKAARSSPATR